MPKLNKDFNGVSRTREILSCTIDFVTGIIVAKTKIILSWDTSCLSTSYEDIEILLTDVPAMESVLQHLSQQIQQVDETYG